MSGQSIGWNEKTGRTEQIPGAAYVCDCSGWIPFVAGNLMEADTPGDVWNSAISQEIRRSILDGDFSYCSRTLCPSIINDTLPRSENVTAPRLRRIIDNHETVLDDGPRLLALGHDSSCNLACPSCRPELMMADREQNARLDRARDRVILPLLKDRDCGLHLTAWGDPFASRHYRAILEALRGDEFAGVKLFLTTNGLLLTPNLWKALPHLAEKIVELRVSVDAATRETYENVRRPGRWEVVEENLEFIGELNRSGIFARNRWSSGSQSVTSDQLLGPDPPTFGICFVVQSANFREMPAFVELGQRVGAEHIIFQKYYSLGHEGAPTFAMKDVGSPDHPEHAEFLEVLRNPLLRSSEVVLTQLGSVALAH